MRQIWLLFFKDLLIERRAWTRLVALICFAIMALLLFSFAVHFITLCFFLCPDGNVLAFVGLRKANCAAARRISLEWSPYTSRLK